MRVMNVFVFNFISQKILKFLLKVQSQFLINESPLKMMENAFYFTLKALQSLYVKKKKSNRNKTATQTILSFLVCS